MLTKNRCSSGEPKGHSAEVACRDCGLDPICRVIDYAEDFSNVPDGVLLRRQKVARGETIFRHRDPFRSIFAVKAGSFKALIPSGEGGEQVVGFFLPGELIGVEAVASGEYPSTARALEASNVCELRIERLPETGRSIETLQQSLIRLLGTQVAFNHSLTSMLVRQSADQRLAAFLLSVHDRFDHRRMARDEFTLNMSRSDIASYLGLASETVSRLMTRFQRDGLIAIQRKRIRILEREPLQQIAGLAR